jgi:ABC-type glycerol-3-phosphate transport system substrate-binding protein
MLLCIGGLKRNRKYLRRTLCAAIVVLAGGIATLLSGCGGSSGANQTGSTPQSYTITVTATAGSLQHSTNVTLTIE